MLEYNEPPVTFAESVVAPAAGISTLICVSLFTILFAVALNVEEPTVEDTLTPICSELWKSVCQFAGSWKLNPVQAPVLPVHVRAGAVTIADPALLVIVTEVVAFTASLIPVPSRATATVFPEILIASVLGIACPCVTAGFDAKPPAKTLNVGNAVADMIGVANANERAIAIAFLFKFNFIFLYLLFL